MKIDKFVLSLVTIIAVVIAFYVNAQIDKKFYELEKQIIEIRSNHSFWVKTISNSSWNNK